ncbi:MAG: hypothetical protein GX605_00975, partial [Chloroflexi bacterium]|nr:hypothetical protein [Chloroflexota bacterium]
MIHYLLPALLFVVGLASVGGALFGRVRRRRIVLAALGVALWAAAALWLAYPPVAPTAPTPTPARPTRVRPAATAQVQQGPWGDVVFHSDRSGDFEIWRMKADGSAPRQLTQSPERDIEPAWSPDGTQIVFASARDDVEDLELYVMNADGSQARRLLESQPGDDWGPRWSPDGGAVVYQSNRDLAWEIYVVQADGTGRTNLTQQAQANDSRPDWSPDGQRIVFVSDRDGDEEIYVMNADGSDQQRLTNSVGDDTLPRWSPDGE